MSSTYFKTKHVTFDMRPLGRLVKGLDRKPTPGSPLDKMYRQWGAYYLTFVRKRWATASKRPGAPWPDLADSTKRSRRDPKQKKNKPGQRARRKKSTRYHRIGRLRGKKFAKTPLSERKFAILRDTSILFNALYIGRAGNLFRVGDDGIDVGFGSDARHREGGKLTLGEIAAVHQTGTKTAGRSRNVTIPKRTILVEPRMHVKRQMSDALDVAIKRLLGGRN